MARLSVSTLRSDGAALMRDGLLDQGAEAGGGGEILFGLGKFNWPWSQDPETERASYAILTKRFN